MFIKTLRKRIALVAVSALSTGFISSVPAQAADNAMATSSVASISLARVTAAPTTGAAVAVNIGADTTAETPGDGDKVKGSLTAYLKAYPAGGSVAVTAEVTLNGDGATASTAIANVTKAASGASITMISTAAATATFGTDVTATSSAGFGSYKFTPTKAGVYTIEVWNDADQDGVIDPTETRQSLDITVVAAATYSNSLSTALIRYDNTATTPDATTSAAQAVGSATAAAANRAAINVLIKDSANNALATGNKLAAEISGPGYLFWENAAIGQNKCSTTPTYGAATGRSLSGLAIDADTYIYVCADGTAGKATVTLKVTDVNDVVTTLATREITFFGAVSKIVATGVLTVGRVAGASNTGAADANRTTAANTPSVIVFATDATGNGVTGLTITAKSTNTGVMSETLGIAEDIKISANVLSSGGAGYYNIRTTASTGSKSGDKTTLTFRVVDPAGDGTTFLTSAVEFTIGGSVATETLSLDKASYAPGEAIVVTRTAKDSSGNPVFDGAASPAVTFTKAVGGTAPAAGVYVKGVSASSTSAATATVFAPVTPGAFSATATSGATGGPTITASAAVADPVGTQIAALVAAIAKLQAAIDKINKRLKKQS